jgi:hypothetical protein
VARSLFNRLRLQTSLPPRKRHRFLELRAYLHDRTVPPERRRRSGKDPLSASSAGPSSSSRRTRSTSPPSRPTRPETRPWHLLSNLPGLPNSHFRNPLLRRLRPLRLTTKRRLCFRPCQHLSSPRIPPRPSTPAHAAPAAPSSRTHLSRLPRRRRKCPRNRRASSGLRGNRALRTSCLRRRSRPTA